MAADNTQKLEIGREYELTISGFEGGRKVVYLGAKQKAWQKTPHAWFIEDTKYADGKPTIWSINIPLNRINVGDAMLEIAVQDISSGFMSHQDKVRLNLQGHRWEELLAAA